MKRTMSADELMMRPTSTDPSRRRRDIGRLSGTLALWVWGSRVEDRDPQPKLRFVVQGRLTLNLMVGPSGGPGADADRVGVLEGGEPTFCVA